MKTKPTRNHLLLLALCVLVALSSLGCREPTVEDVKEWAQDEKQAEKKLREFILGETSFEVKLEALHSLIIRGDVFNLSEILSRLDDNTRLQLIQHIIPRLQAMMASDSQNSRVRAKDGAYYLLLVEGVPEQEQAQLRELIYTWMTKAINGKTNYWRPMELSGHVDRSKLLAVLGERALDVLGPELRRKLDQYMSAREEAKANEQRLSDVFERKWQLEMVQLYTDLQGLNLEAGDQRIIDIWAGKIGEDGQLQPGYVERMLPDLPRPLTMPFYRDRQSATIAGTPFSFNAIKRYDPSAPNLVDLSRQILLHPEGYKHRDTEGVREYLIQFYYPEVAAQMAEVDGKSPLREAIATCSQLIAQDRSGYMRWRCAKFFVQVRERIDPGNEGLAVEYVVDYLPNDPQRLRIPDDHPLVASGTWSSDTFVADEMKGFCTRLNDRPSYGADPPLDKIRGYVESDKLVQRLLAVSCLAVFGTAEDAARLRALFPEVKEGEEDPSPSLEGWQVPYATLGAYAREIAKQIDPPQPEEGGEDDNE